MLKSQICQMMVNLVVARNDDRSFRASHTVEIMVTLPPDFVHGRVINVPRIVMKEGETTPRIPLKSVAVKITPGWPECEDAPTKYWLSTLPRNITFRDLVDAAK